ncbi:ABC transporter substrate-binding protein [Polycladomyces subterraneus]|uniref:ABC transporter substrate-binding protein n=1 Tax=Polycladomyces subterraneus TaxID=1016997 RepID=A0ABT8ITG8_9BACL|nr:ABC transporter substrate-binding protein [Polycladomyces subterraneus]MDN4595334.1 ABC transporter substrate-binding protein [Polycladomyces subterraneus]
MKQWKKWVSAGLALTMAVSLAACSPGGSDADSGSGGKVKIVYARGKDVTQATKKLVAAFEKTHPNIDVVVREMPADTGQSHDQYVTMLSSKSSEIDVFDLDVIWPSEFAQAGYLLPLDRFIQKDRIDMSKYVPGAVEAGKFEGKQWVMPKFIDAGLLYYRKDLIKQPPKTWDELIQMAKQTKGKGGTKFGYLMQAKQYEGLVCNFLEFISAYGGKILDDQGHVVINSPQTIKGLKKMIEIARSDFVPSNITTFTELESHTAFLEGQSAMIRNWPYMYALVQDPAQSKVKDKVGVAPLPAGDHGSAATLGGWMTGINRYSKHPKEAWELVKFMTGLEGQKITAQYGGSAPTYLPAYNDPAVKNANPLFAQKDFVKGVSKAVPRPVSPDYPKISDIIQIEVSKAIVGKQTAEQAVKNMEQKLKQVVKQ